MILHFCIQAHMHAHTIKHTDAGTNPMHDAQILSMKEKRANKPEKTYSCLCVVHSGGALQVAALKIE